MKRPLQTVQDVVFKGCTRKPTFLGVPLLPFLASAGSCVVLAMYLSLWFLTLAPILVLICRQLCANDDSFFQLAYLRLSMRANIRNVHRNGGLWRIDPSETRDCALNRVYGGKR